MEPTNPHHFDVIVKEPLVRGPLALYPLFTLAPAAPAYLTGPEADRLGVLRVAEKPGGATVPELTVHNTGALPLLLLEGETLVGAKQNRTLDASVLVPAGAAADIAVSCVEAGRWGAPRASTRSLRHAPADLRRVKTATLAREQLRASKQAAVWSRIARYEQELGAASPTSAMEDVAESRTADVSSLVASSRPLPNQCGVAVAIGATVRGFDCFDKPSTLAVYWDSLVAGYALDAVGAPVDAAPAPAVVEAVAQAAAAAPRSPGAPAGLGDSATAAATAPRASGAPAGLGDSATFASDVIVGTELRWFDAYVHVSAFVDETVRSSDPAGSRARPVRPIRPRWSR